MGEATDAETNEDVVEVREVEVAASRAAVRRMEEPGAAAQQPSSLCEWIPFLDGLLVQPGRAIRGSPFIAVVPMIQAPLPHIAVHVVQSPGVRRKHPHWRGLLPVFALGPIGIDIISIVIGQFCGDCLAKMKRRCRARPAGVFPLRFAWQGVPTARALAQAGAKFYCLIPAYLFYRPLICVDFPFQ